MVKQMTKQFLNGVWVSVEEILYSNGRRVRRILNDNYEPIDIITLDVGKRPTRQPTQSDVALKVMAAM